MQVASTFSSSHTLRHAAQEVAFFDLPENASGAQSTRLAEDTAVIRGAVGDQLGAVAQSLTTFVAGGWPAMRLLLYCLAGHWPCFAPTFKGMPEFKVCLEVRVCLCFGSRVAEIW